MIQDIAPHKYDIGYKSERVAAGTDIMCLYSRDGILCRIEKGEVIYPTVKEVSKVFSKAFTAAFYLFDIDGVGYFTLTYDVIEPFDKWTYVKKEKIRELRPVWKAFAAITGYQIHEWYEKTEFCCRCGRLLRMHYTERAMLCTECGHVTYPHINPSVIVAVTNGDKLLMTKYAEGHSSYDKYALVAGYSEIGESLEDTVRREVKEEVGLDVKNIRYYKSQPWSFSDALLVGFVCEVDGSDEVKLDENELSVAEWFDRDKLPKERSEGEISLTGEMIDAFQNGTL